jgi:hypothetical protein
MYYTAKTSVPSDVAYPLMLPLSRQPSSLLCDEDWVGTEADAEHDYDSHSPNSATLYPSKSAHGSSKGSSLNHSHRYKKRAGSFHGVEHSTMVRVLEMTLKRS